jgi:hypothetical protein
MIEKNGGEVIAYEILLFQRDLTAALGRGTCQWEFDFPGVSVKSNKRRRERRIHEQEAGRRLQTIVRLWDCLYSC